jgi:hypothetical protein
MQLDQAIELLDRFAEWARYFGIKTKIRHIQSFLLNSISSGMMPMSAVVVWSAE